MFLKTKYIVLVAILLIFGVLFYTKWSLDRTPAQNTSNTSFPKLRGAPELRDVLNCALNTLESNSNSTNIQSQWTLDLLYFKLAEKFDFYGIFEDLEKIHFLSQAMVETQDFLFMVEKRSRQNWNNALQNIGYLGWDCRTYRSAIDGDKDYFDRNYRYRVTFRGRGLHHLTWCVNYLGFFYHKAAQLIDHGNSSQMKTYFKYDDGKSLDLGTFCDANILRSVSLEEFEAEGLPPLSEDIIGNFENAANTLSLPCEGYSIPFIHAAYQCPQTMNLPCSREPSFRSMDNTEFIIDSSLWHWKKCRRLYGEDLKKHSSESVGTIAYCIHGDDAYLDYNQSSCSSNTGRYIGSYCSRLRRFNILKGCLEE